MLVTLLQSLFCLLQQVRLWFCQTTLPSSKIPLKVSFHPCRPCHSIIPPAPQPIRKFACDTVATLMPSFNLHDRQLIETSYLRLGLHLLSQSCTPARQTHVYTFSRQEFGPRPPRSIYIMQASCSTCKTLLDFLVSGLVIPNVTAMLLYPLLYVWLICCRAAAVVQRPHPS